MHNGTFKTLGEVVAFYDKGGDKTVNQSNLIKPLNLTEKEEKALVAFLESCVPSKPLIASR
jgi:cytochrome c peroxidase